MLVKWGFLRELGKVVGVKGFCNFGCFGWCEGFFYSLVGKMKYVKLLVNNFIKGFFRVRWC